MQKSPVSSQVSFLSSLHCALYFICFGLPCRLVTSVCHCLCFLHHLVPCLLFYWSFVSPFSPFHLTSHCEKGSCVFDVVVCGFVFVPAYHAVTVMCSWSVLCAMFPLHVSIAICVRVCVWYVYQSSVEISRLQHLCKHVLNRKWITVVGLSTSIKNNSPHETTFVLPVVPLLSVSISTVHTICFVFLSQCWKSKCIPDSWNTKEPDLDTCMWLLVLQ